MAEQISQNAKGVTVGDNAIDKVGFHGVASAQRSGAAQAAVAATTGAALAVTASTATTPFGYTTQAQADGIIARVNSLIVDNAALLVLVNELRAALVAKGVIKGS